MYWKTPNSHRREELSNDPSKGEPKTVLILFEDEPGIEINNVTRTYRRKPAAQGHASPLTTLQELASYKKLAKQSLGTKTIKNVACEGYEIPLREIDQSIGEGTMTIWIDESTHLPVEYALKVYSDGEEREMRFSNFVWNPQLDPELFTTDAPAGFKNTSQESKSVSEQTKRIVEALSFYSKLSGGKYPQVKVVYGDVIRDKLMELAGFEGRDRSEYLEDDNYRLLLESGFGFAMMNEIMRNNPEASYHGLTVTPDDEDKELFRWKLDDGGYQVIYGDLRTVRE